MTDFHRQLVFRKQSSELQTNSKLHGGILDEDVDGQ